MDLMHHRLPDDVFAALAAGGGGREAIRELAAAEHSKHLILLAGVLDTASDPRQRSLARTGFDLLTEAWHADRAAAETVIRYPSVGAWAELTLRARRSGIAVPGAEPSRMLAVAAAAAIRARLSTEIEIPVSGDQLALPSLGTASVPGRVAQVRVAEDHAAVGLVEVPADPHQDATGWRGLRRTRTGSFDVLIDDLDPFRLPGLTDLAPRANIQPWEPALRDAWRLLDSHHPGIAAEIAEGVSMIVPRISPRTGLVSTTSPRAFGAVGISLPPAAVTGAETLAHEIQHLKLGALQHITHLTLPDDGSRFYAPWRDDPRPLDGLLQGTYAYLGVTDFWRRQRRIDSGSRNPDAEYARWREATALGVETIRSSGRLTSAGKAFVDGMASTLESWSEEQVPAPARAEARKAAEAHLERWESVNGPIR